MTYTKLLPRFKYTQLDKQQRATYYLDFLSDRWEPNLEIVVILNTPINKDDSCPDMLHDPYRGCCGECKWFLGIDNLTKKGCCGLKLHIK